MSEFLVPAHDRVDNRRAVRLGCEVVRTRDWRPIGGAMVDLSPGGMQLLATRDELQMTEHGEELQVLFRVPFSPTWVFVEGIVSRFVRGQRPGDAGPSLGVRFGGLDPETEALLRGALWRFPPTIPWRKKRIDYAASVRLIGCS